MCVSSRSKVVVTLDSCGTTVVVPVAYNTTPVYNRVISTTRLHCILISLRVLKQLVVLRRSAFQDNVLLYTQQK